MAYDLTDHVLLVRDYSGDASKLTELTALSATLLKLADVEDGLDADQLAQAKRALALQVNHCEDTGTNAHSAVSQAGTSLSFRSEGDITVDPRAKALADALIAEVTEDEDEGDWDTITALP